MNSLRTGHSPAKKDRVIFGGFVLALVCALAVMLVWSAGAPALSPPTLASLKQPTVAAG